MANSPSITRRAAIVGAAATATVAVIPPAIGRVYRTGAHNIDDQLNELADDFYRHAVMIDPTITGHWHLTDETVADRRPLSGLFLERNGVSIIKKSSTTAKQASEVELDQVEKMISAYRAAIDHHEELFTLNDNGLATDEAVNATLGPIDDALEALCRFRPTYLGSEVQRREFLSSTLTAETDDRPEFTRRIFEALLA